MSLPQFPEAWPPFSQHRKPDVLVVARGSAESDLCTHAALPDHGPKGLALDTHWGLTYRRSSHTQPLQHNSATGSATPWPPNVRRSERNRKKIHPRAVEKIRVRQLLPGKRKGCEHENAHSWLSVIDSVKLGEEELSPVRTIKRSQPLMLLAGSSCRAFIIDGNYQLNAVET
ncbi:hypothetical protein J6590_095245 [Homalodisca vitripennis]|nr:hypothetical protein J6590_095245 [Homalodisca vitripennis]